MSRYDKIRNMSLEKLAKLLTYCDYDGTMICPDGKQFYRDSEDKCIEKAEQHTVSWLKQEEAE